MSAQSGTSLGHVAELVRAAVPPMHPGGRPIVRAPLSAPLDSPAGKRQFRRGVLDAADGSVREVGASPASHLLAAMARADCLIVLPEETTTVEQGGRVEVWLLDG